MRRRLFAVASALSLLVCVATVVLWVRSHWVAYALGGTTPGSIYSAVASRGRIGVGLASLKSGGFSFYHSSSGAPWDIGAYGTLGRLGFFVDTRRAADGRRRIAVVFPIGAIAVAATVLPGSWLVMGIRKRSEKGRCPTCGYNLTGNTSGVCPECGTPWSARAALHRAGFSCAGGKMAEWPKRSRSGAP